jgi:hypothetical protein
MGINLIKSNGLKKLKMKNNLLKYYILAFCLCSNFVLFAQLPGDTGDGTGGVEGGDLETPSSTGDGAGGLEGTDPAAPIDTYLWILALVVILYIFLKFRALQNKENH